MTTLVYCASCGNRLSYPLKQKQIDSYMGMPIYGTACCGSKIFSEYDIHWDYCDRPINGNRISHTDLSFIVKLCCHIITIFYKKGIYWKTLRYKELLLFRSQIKKTSRKIKKH